jgi:hypothetical protein
MSGVVQTWHTLLADLGGGITVGILTKTGMRWMWKAEPQDKFVSCDVPFYDIAVDPVVTGRMVAQALKQQHAKTTTPEAAPTGEVPPEGELATDS